MSALDELGTGVAETQDALRRESSDLPEVRSRLLARKPRRQQPGRVLALGVAAVAAAAAALVALWPRPEVDEHITFRVGATAGTVGQFIAPEESADLSVEFSDGSRFVLAPGSGARVSEVSGNGARVSLERGRARVAVRHLPDASWELNVGPFDVAVIGTEFWVAWDPAQELFELSLSEGQVRVQGPTLHERMVESGESVRIWVGEGRAEFRTGEPEDESAPSSEPEGVDEPVPEPSREAETEPANEAERTPEAARPPRGPDWRQLVRDGRYDAALEEVDGRGLDRALERGSAADLSSLADAARFSRRTDDAVTIYEAIRRRFEGTEAAATAAFALGRIQFDQRRAPAAAARSFATYLRERPRGRFAAEAAGRLIEARQRAGDTSGARRAAEEYLRRHPEGPHAALARSLGGGR